MRVKSAFGFSLVGILAFSGVMAAPAAPAAPTVLANDSAIPTPPSVTRLVTKATPVERDVVILTSMTVTCKHKKCPKRKKIFDEETLLTQVPRVTCAREALTALAKWRDFCALDTLFNQFCWYNEPTLKTCCGKTIKYNNPAYLDYPTARARRQINTAQTAPDRTFAYRLEYPEIKDKFNETRVIIMHQPGNYNEENKECHIFRSQSLKEFHYWMGVLNYYGIEDSDENGKVFGMEKWNPEGMWHNVVGWVGGAELVAYEEAIIKSGWKG